MATCGTKIVTNDEGEWHCPNCHATYRQGIYSILWQDGPAPETCQNDVAPASLPPLEGPIEDRFHTPALYGRLGGE